MFPEMSEMRQGMRHCVARIYAWACERLYHELAWGYEWVAVLVSLGRWGDWRRMALAEVTGPRVLELGSGTGALLVEGSGERQMIGLDPSPEMQRVAARRLAAHQSPAMPIQGYAQALPLADGCVDSVIATFPAPYIVAPSTLRECARVLRPGGRLVIGGVWVSVDLRGWERWIPVFYGKPSDAAQAQWTARLASAGFAAEVVERCDGLFRVGIVIGRRGNVQTHAKAAMS